MSVLALAASQPVGAPGAVLGSQEARVPPSLCLRSHPRLTQAYRVVRSREQDLELGVLWEAGLGCVAPGVWLSPGCPTAGPWGHQVPELKGGEHSGHPSPASLSPPG